MLLDFFDKARFYFYAGELQKSRDTLLRGLDSLPANPEDPEGVKVLARLYTNLAATCIRMFDLEPADNYLKLAEELAVGIDPPHYGMLATQANCRGAFMRLTGDLDNALKQYKRAEELARKIEKEPERNMLRRSPIFNIAMHYMELGDLAEVKRTVNRLQELKTSGGTSKDVADAGRFELLGQLLMQLLNEQTDAQAGNEDSTVAQAIQHFVTARQMYQAAGYGYRVWQCDINVLRLKFRADYEDHDLALELERIVEYSRQNDSPGMAMQAEVLRVEYLVISGKHAQARGLILELIAAPPELPPHSLAAHYGQLKQQAKLMKDDVLVGMLDDAIGRLAAPVSE